MQTLFLIRLFLSVSFDNELFTWVSLSCCASIILIFAKGFGKQRFTLKNEQSVSKAESDVVQIEKLRYGELPLITVSTTSTSHRNEVPVGDDCPIHDACLTLPISSCDFNGCYWYSPGSENAMVRAARIKPSGKCCCAFDKTRNNGCAPKDTGGVVAHVVRSVKEGAEDIMKGGEKIATDVWDSGKELMLKGIELVGTAVKCIVETIREILPTLGLELSEVAYEFPGSEITLTIAAKHDGYKDLKKRCDEHQQTANVNARVISAEWVKDKFYLVMKKALDTYEPARCKFGVLLEKFELTFKGIQDTPSAEEEHSLMSYLPSFISLKTTVQFDQSLKTSPECVNNSPASQAPPSASGNVRP